MASWDSGPAPVHLDRVTTFTFQYVCQRLLIFPSMPLSSPRSPHTRSHTPYPHTALCTPTHPHTRARAHTHMSTHPCEHPHMGAPTHRERIKARSDILCLAFRN